MSVSTTASQVTYSGNASTSAAYPVSFPFFDATDLSVVVNTGGVPTTLVNGTGYTVTGGNGTTGSITTTSAIPATSTVIITRSTSKTQLTSYTTGDRFPASAHEKALDKLTMLVQEAATIPGTATASGAAPYVLQASSAGATPAWVPQSSGGIAAGAITNTMLAGGITPGKLSTGGPVWDAFGNLTATSFNGPVTGAVTGNASTATRLTTPRTIGLSGDVTGTASFDGSANATIAATVPNNTITAAKLGTTERLQIAKCWVNFNGELNASGTAGAGSSLSVTSGSSIGTWSGAGGWTSANLGNTYTFNISGTNQTLGGVNVSTVGVQITNIVSSTVVQFTLLAGPATVSQTVNGNGAASGFAWNRSAIRSSYNVSSITKNNTGNYTVNFATPMADADYAVVGSINSTGSGTSSNFSGGATVYTTSSFKYNIYLVNAGYDMSIVNIQVFGN